MIPISSWLWSETLRASPAQVRFITMPSRYRYGILAFDAPIPPRLDFGVDLLVEVRHRARAHPRVPQRALVTSTRPAVVEEQHRAVLTAMVTARSASFTRLGGAVVADHAAEPHCNPLMSATLITGRRMALQGQRAILFPALAS